MNGAFDTSGFKALTGRARKLNRVFAEEVDALAEEVGKDLFETVRKNTPVGHTLEETPGRLKAGWTQGKRAVGRHGRAVQMVNTVPYAKYVEYGHKVKVHGKEAGWVKGRYFVKKSRKRVKKRLRGYYDEMIDRIEGRMGR